MKPAPGGLMSQIIKANHRRFPASRSRKGYPIKEGRGHKRVYLRKKRRGDKPHQVICIFTPLRPKALKFIPSEGRRQLQTINIKS